METDDFECHRLAGACDKTMTLKITGFEKGVVERKFLVQTMGSTLVWTGSAVMGIPSQKEERILVTAAGMSAAL